MGCTAGCIICTVGCWICGCSGGGGGSKGGGGGNSCNPYCFCWCCCCYFGCGPGGGKGPSGSGKTNVSVSQTSPVQNPPALQPVTVHGGQVNIPSDTMPLSISPVAQQTLSPLSLQQIQQAAAGGLIGLAAGGGSSLPMTENRSHGKQFAFQTGYTGLNAIAGTPMPLTVKKAAGGDVENFNPQFFSEGGENASNTYVEGDGDGTSDSVPAMLANGEFVIPADVVADLGNGSNQAGAELLDKFLEVVREDKHSNDPSELPPDSKGPLAYLQEAKNKVKS